MRFAARSVAEVAVEDLRLSFPDSILNAVAVDGSLYSAWGMMRRSPLLILCGVERGFTSIDLRTQESYTCRTLAPGGSPFTLRTKMVEDPSEPVVWLGSDQGLLRFDHQRRTVEVVIAEAVSELLMDRDGTLWVGTPAGLVKVPALARAVRTFEHTRPGDLASVKKPFLHHLCVDDHGQLWVSSWKSGLQHWNKDGTYVRHYDRTMEHPAWSGAEFEEGLTTFSPDRWQLALSHGVGHTPPSIDLDVLATASEGIHLTTAHEKNRLARLKVVVPVFHEQRPLAYLLIGDLDEDEQRMSPSVKHLNFIQTLTNLIVVALENKRLAAQALQQERDKRELELDAEMQGMLVPQELPRTDRFEAAAWYLPHRQVGGDHYDVVHRGDRMVLVVADVSGKGMAAALLASNFQATLRAMLTRDHERLDVMVQELNRLGNERARGERFITLFIGVADTRKGVLGYVNAGHNAPILCARAGSRN